MPMLLLSVACLLVSRRVCQDPAFFVGKVVLLKWLNEFFAAGYSKVEETCTGAMHCQILDAIYPCVPDTPHCSDGSARKRMAHYAPIVRNSKSHLLVCLLPPLLLLSAVARLRWAK